MPCKNRMGTFSSDRKRSSLKMSHPHLQDRFTRTMIDRKFYFYSGNPDISHHSGAVYIQKTFVILIYLLFSRSKRIQQLNITQHFPVICSGICQHFFIFLIAALYRIFIIGGNYPRLILLIKVIADRWI